MQEINLYQLLRFYAKKFYILIIFTLLGFFIGLIYTSFIQTPQYKSSSTILIAKSERLESSRAVAMNNLVEMVKSRAVIESAKNELNLNLSYEQISNLTKVTNPKDTSLIKIEVIYKNPKTSQDLVKAIAESFEKNTSTLYDNIDLKNVDEPSLATTPHNIKINIQLATFTLAGFIFSVIVLFFIFDYRLNIKNSAKDNKEVNVKQNSDNIHSNYEKKHFPVSHNTNNSNKKNDHFIGGL